MTTLKHHRGYSLLELIVSLGIFSVVMLVVLAAYVNLISLDRRARATNQLSSSLSFSVETMARSLRTGTEYACNANSGSPNCSSGGTSISFKDADGVYARYSLLTDANGNGVIGYCTGSCSTVSALTDNRINITLLQFYVQGVGTGDNSQPQVTVSISGWMRTDSGERADFSIQTGATQRVIDI